MQSAGFEHAKLDRLGLTIKVVLLSSSLKRKKETQGSAFSQKLF